MQGSISSTTRMHEAPKEVKKAFQPNFSTRIASGTPALAAPAGKGVNLGFEAELDIVLILHALQSCVSFE